MPTDSTRRKVAGLLPPVYSCASSRSHQLCAAVYVYVLRDGNWPSHVKIGCTDSPDLRIGQLRTSNPRDLHFIYIHRAVGMSAYELEQQAHQRFQRHRYMSSEWFSVSADLVVDFLRIEDPGGQTVLDERR